MLMQVTVWQQAPAHLCYVQKTIVMEYNLSFYDVVGRYAIMMVVVILGGILHSLPVMLLALPFFATALLGWCPLYKMLGINHAVKDNH
jgi:hypothetical protein